MGGMYRHIGWLGAAIFCSCALIGLHGQEPIRREASTMLARTPPMGWNSWDSYGTTVGETQVKANAEWMAAHLKQHGWQYIVVDMEWFVTNPVAEGNATNFHYSLDGEGRYVPAPNRFPSAGHGEGFAQLAAYVHARGLKFGIHILQGIPREAVTKNLPIAGSRFRASDAANSSGRCNWNHDNFDLKDTAAGQAYYDSIARLYAGWGVDLIKVDCIASRPYKGAEIRMLSGALRKTGRPIVLSLSPGSAPLDKLDEMRKYAQMWRISDDVWDEWYSDVEYPQGLGDQFPRVAKWAPFSKPGLWPDADMLPLGYLGPSPGWGKARQTRLSSAEQRTMMTLWSIFRSPLMMGGDLPHNDAETTALLTNDEVLAVDQHSTGGRAVLQSPVASVWTAEMTSGKGRYLAIFNTSNQAQELDYTWQQLGWPSGRYALRELWEHTESRAASGVSVHLAPHACALYRANAVTDR
ncbi:MAG TPA: glycoside hydrolase family 27 protein [Acidobacteriaceae bacterium]|jgi:alpha-galactosidase|nr:glycoside hydrolase family 27 protein [Acidobacteriaceae bacterium]